MIRRIKLLRLFLKFSPVVAVALVLASCGNDNAVGPDNFDTRLIGLWHPTAATAGAFELKSNGTGSAFECYLEPKENQDLNLQFTWETTNNNSILKWTILWSGQDEFAIGDILSIIYEINGSSLTLSFAGDSGTFVKQ